ncbi:MAG: S46 family peptidase, partial [Planctomycetota bacterium]
MPRLPRVCLPGTLLALSLSSLPLHAQANFELGKMWTFEDPPLSYLAEEYGFRPSSEWLSRVMLASLRFGGGCSASFVSPKGLIMTNHHCVRDQIAAVQGERDLVRDGFTAAGLEDEIPLPGLTVQQMVQARDVTAEVNAGTTDSKLSESEITAKRAANQEAILSKAREENP